jgi:hypothetical protein
MTERKGKVRREKGKVIREKGEGGVDLPCLTISQSVVEWVGVLILMSNDEKSALQVFE